MPGAVLPGEEQGLACRGTGAGADPGSMATGGDPGTLSPEVTTGTLTSREGARDTQFQGDPRDPQMTLRHLKPQGEAQRSPALR